MNNNKVGAAEKMKAGPQNEFKPGTAMHATSTVEISISCRNLANKDVLSKSDPICIVYHKQLNSKKWVELLRTEMIENNLNPDFVTKLTMEYRFEQSQHVRFEVYDIDSETSDLEDHDVIGHAECTVAQIVSAGPSGFVQELLSTDAKATSTSSNGTIILIAEELASLKDEIFLKVGASSLGSCATCFMPKTFFTISRINDAKNFLVIHRSKQIRGLNPVWPSVTISGRSLCNGDKDRQLKLEAYRRTLKGEEEFIGSCLTTVNRMTQMLDDSMQLKGKNGETTKATLSILACSVLPLFTFLDYVQAGTRIHLCFSIDFTSSNGDPTEATSLHHISNDPRITNPYEQAIEATGQVIKDYDNTGIFPVFGFGARIPPKGQTSHEFPVTLGATPNCIGVAGVIRAYRKCIGRIQLYGPTNFAPVINRVAAMAAKSGTGQHYYILVILTDGVITDILQTKEAIVNASGFPISIIIVGVGEADFAAMEDLDGDEGTVCHMGRYAERDIVQFVAYRSAESWLHRTGESTTKNLNNETQPPLPNLASFTGVGSTGSVGSVGSNVAKRQMTNLMAQGQLAEEILEEIPDQLTGYMKSRGIEPNMVKKMDNAKPEDIFAEEGQDKVDVAANLENMRKLIAIKEEERKEEQRKKEGEEKKRNKLSRIWNLLSLITRGKRKFESKTRITANQLQQPLTDPATIKADPQDPPV